MRLLTAGALAAGVALVIALGAVSWSYFSNYWFPWLVIACGQAPCALVWAGGMQMLVWQKTMELARTSQAAGAQVIFVPLDQLPHPPDYKFLNPPSAQVPSSTRVLPPTA